MTATATKDLIEAFYNRLWNRWDTDLAPQILAHTFRFRGSLGTETTGIDGFLSYMATIRAGFPDFSNKIEDLIVAGDRAAARLIYSGTHSGAVLGFAPTGSRIEYSGAAFFSAKDGRLEEAWVLGDLETLKSQLS